jgi:tetratricopeptide (TPR) repeat protein
MKLVYTTVTILLSFTLVLHGATDVSNLNREGVEACKQGDYQKGISLFKEAYTADPGNETVAGNLISATRNYAARLYKQGKPEEAAATLREGLSLIPGSAPVRTDLISVLYNLGIVCLKNHNIAEAKKKSGEVLTLDPGNATAHMLAGEVAYMEHRMQDALQHWQKAFASDPSNHRLAARVDKLKRELKTEQRYSKTGAYHFDIRFDYQALGNGVFDIREFLMDAYNRVGQDFNCFPDYPIMVILYKENEFRMVNNVPEFVAGLYDGKIRVPVNFSRYPLPELKGILFHEYAHAVVYDLARSACPIWLNEGIAMRAMNPYLPVNTAPLKQALKSNSLLSLDQLSIQRTWRDPRLVALAYSQAWIMAEYLFYRWSSSQMKKMLQRFREGATFHAVLTQDMNRTPEQFEKEWVQFAKKRVF